MISLNKKRGVPMRRRAIIIGIVAIIILFLSHATWLYFNLDIGEDPVLSDVIIVPEGISEERSVKAAELLHEGYSESDKIIVSPLYTPDFMFDMSYAYRDAGVDVPNQVIPENEATSTWTNALNTLAIMEANDWDSAIVVTSDYHTRRTRLSFERVNEDYGYDLTYVSAHIYNDGVVIPYNDHPNNQNYALLEIPKYYGYLLGLYNWIDM